MLQIADNQCDTGEGSGEGGKMQKFTHAEPPNRRGFVVEK